jgi:hypothetical protein
VVEQVLDAPNPFLTDPPTSMCWPQSFEVLHEGTAALHVDHIYWRELEGGAWLRNLSHTVQTWAEPPAVVLTVACEVCASWQNGGLIRLSVLYHLP